MKYLPIIFFVGLLAFSGCTIDDQVDPNNPSINSVAENASITELNLLVSGTEALMREGFSTYVTASGSVAREMYKFDADPRNTEELLGKDGAALDNNTFYLTAPYNTRYRVIKNCNILLDALDNTSSVTDAEKDGYRAFANTIKAYMLFHVALYLNDNGIRVDVGDPANLGPFVSKAEAFTEINRLLDLAFTQGQGSSFLFSLSSGFDGFNTPATFGEFNRAIAARVAVNNQEYDRALTLLGDSFFDIAGDLTTGPDHVFSTASGDILNDLFKTPQQNGDQLIVHDRIIADTIAGDARNAKFGLRNTPTSQDGLNGTHETRLYATATSPINIIRNEELILIYAEANISSSSPNLGEAVAAIDKVRADNGIPAYSGAVTAEDLINEMLFQRTYSLWGEGHAMFDQRRYGRLNDQFLPLDRPGDIIHTEFPIPQAEGQ